MGTVQAKVPDLIKIKIIYDYVCRHCGSLCWIRPFYRDQLLSKNLCTSNLCVHFKCPLVLQLRHSDHGFIVVLVKSGKETAEVFSLTGIVAGAIRL